MKRHPPPIAITRARQLRREMTDAERAMWRILKAIAPEARWRRQVPLQSYIVDFASHRARLVIEVDGGQHSADADAFRTSRIEHEGYRVLRFWNHEVLQNPDGCAIIVRTALADFSPPANFG